MHAMDMDKRDATHEHKNSDDVNPTVKTDEPTLAFIVAPACKVAPLVAPLG